jgi:hypothetical protein
MALGQQQTVARTPASTAAASDARSRASRIAPLASWEIAGYTLIGVGLAALLWSHVSDVDGFYLDEWFYVHGAQYIWENLPGGLIEAIPEWNRGPQRLYSTVLAGIWGPFSPSTAYTISHVVNVLLLVSAIVPVALLARRIIDSPVLRVLAVGLAVAVPWLTIGAHLLTESVAFPLYLWAIYAIVRCAEEPSPARQAVALIIVALLTLCRLNLASVVVVLFAGVLAGEILRRRDERDRPRGHWIRAALRREALIVAAAVIVAVLAVILAVRGGSGVSTHYGGLDFDTATERLFGDGAANTRRTMLTYMRDVVVGGFVLPVAIGLGVALAGLAGRAGRRLVIPSVVALASLAVTILVVSTSTVGGAIEERYVMYVYPPIAVLAVAGLPQLHRLRGWLVAGGALTVWALIAGFAAPADNAAHFFASPASAFWTRVVQHRLVGLEADLFGWAFLGSNGWLLVAVGLVLLIVLIGLAAKHGRANLVVPVVAGALVLCAIAQVAALDYAFKQELGGTSTAPGGIAQSEGHDRDRETWLDAEIPDGESAAVLPGLVSGAGPWGRTEVLQFWNEELHATVVPWNGAAAPVPPGYSWIGTQLADDGLATWAPRPQWFAAQRFDPRVQFAGEMVARSPISEFALYRSVPSDKALWTSDGLEPDGAVLEDRPVRMTLNRDVADGAGAVVLRLGPPAEARRAVRWRIAGPEGKVAAGTLRRGIGDGVRLPIPECQSGRSCPPARWTLRATGRPVQKPLPAFGAPGAPRPVLLEVAAAWIG